MNTTVSNCHNRKHIRHGIMDLQNSLSLVSMFSIFCVRIPGEEGSELMTEAPDRIEVKHGEEGADPEVVEHEQLLAALSG